MRALLLAAGLGTRLRPITDSTPKCLVPIGGRPLLDYWFEHLLSQGTIERVLINTHHLADQVRDHVSRSRWSSCVDVVHERELLGTAGTIKANRRYFGGDSFMVAHADNLTTFDLEAFVVGHLRRPGYCAMSMLVFRSDNPSSCGIVELDEHGVVRAFHEKAEDPPGNLANAAVYMLMPEVADFIERSSNEVIDFSTKIIPHFLGRIHAIENDGYHRDIGTVEALELANSEFFGR